MVRQKFATLLKSVGNCPSEWTVLGFWLGIYWSQQLDQVVKYFNRNGSAKKQTAVDVQQTKKPEAETEIAEDEWDEEHVAEIQGNIHCVLEFANSIILVCFINS